MKTKQCTCYVSHLSPEARFATRYGAHSPQCPVYRRSGDVVDRAKDIQFRAEHDKICSQFS